MPDFGHFQRISGFLFDGVAGIAELFKELVTQRGKQRPKQIRRHGYLENEKAKKNKVASFHLILITCIPLDFGVA